MNKHCQLHFQSNVTFTFFNFSSTDRFRSHEVRLRAPRLLQAYRGRDERDSELARVRRDRALLRQRLEDTEWSLCQRAGEIALLKTQLKDAQVSTGHGATAAAGDDTDGASSRKLAQQYLLSLKTITMLMQTLRNFSRYHWE